MRIVGWLASAVGVVGVMFGNGLASVVWVLRFNIQSRLRDLLAVPDGGLDIATTLTETVASGITEMSGQIIDVKAAADRLAAAPAGDASAVAGLASAIDTFVEGPYSMFRTVYQRLRERAMVIGESLTRLGTSVPLAKVPPAAVERLQAIDARMVEIDASVTYLAGLGPTGLVEPGVASTISERAARAEETLASMSELVTEIEQWIQDARERLEERQQRLFRWLTAGTAVASVAGLLFAGLNVLLFQQGRRWSGRR